MESAKVHCWTAGYCWIVHCWCRNSSHDTVPKYFQLDPIGFMWNPGLSYDPSSERNTQKAGRCFNRFCVVSKTWLVGLLVTPKNMSYSTLNPHKGSKMNRLSTKQCLLWGVFFISGPTTDTFVVIPFLWLNIRHIFMKPPAKSSASYKPTMYAHLTWFK